MRVAVTLLSAWALLGGCLGAETTTSTTTTIPAGAEGGYCNYVTGVECGPDLMCESLGDPDGGGVCVNPDESGCSVPADCEGRPHIMCAGAWKCESGKCGWDCEIPEQDHVVVAQ